MKQNPAMDFLCDLLYFRHQFEIPRVQLNALVSLLLMISLQCYNAQETTRIRLVNGATLNEGRVEIDLDDGRGWGTICDNGWDYHDAAVICKQIGYPAATYSTSGARYGGNPDLPVLLENVVCTPSHTTIGECPSAGPSASCDHSNDGGVKCMIPSFLGCFSVFAIGSRAWTILENSNDACIAHCKDLDYRYAGMSGSTCRCGSTSRYYFYNQHVDYFCNNNCKGDATQLCGNSDNSYYSVFDTTLGVCEDPGTPEHGDRSGDDFAFASTVSFSCDADYVLSGGPVLQCVLGKTPHDVTWNATVPECVRSISTPNTSVRVETSTMNDVTMGFMTSSERPTSLQNNRSLSIGSIAGIVVVLLIITIALVILTVLYIRKRKKEPTSTGSEYQPEIVNKRANSEDNIYEIDESDVLENEIALTPSPSNGHTTVDARNQPGNTGNGYNPRTLPSIHLYADVAIPREDLISPTSDYGTVDYDRSDQMTPRTPGNGVQNDDQSFYFVLEEAGADDNSKDHAKTPRHKKKPQVKPTGQLEGRFVKKKPLRNAPKSLKMNQGASARNLENDNNGNLLERMDVLSSEGAVSEQTEASSSPNEPKSPKYGNSEFHEVPKNLIENDLYRPTEFMSSDAVGADEKLSVPVPKTRLRNNSESEATPKTPPYANFDAKRRRSTGEPKGTQVTSNEDDDTTSPFYTNTEFHAIPDNLVDNELYKPCTPGHIDG